MGNFDLSFKVTPEDTERGWINRERYWGLVKAAVVSRGDEITDITPVEGLGYLLVTKSGYVVHHKAMADRLLLPKKEARR